MTPSPLPRRVTDWVLILAVTLVGLDLTYSRLYQRPDPEIVMGRHDNWAYFGPMAFYFDHVIRHGDAPLWNPLTFCGAPYAANPQTATFYPVHLVRALLNVPLYPYATHYSLVIMTMAHFLLLSAGVFILCRDHGLSRPGAMTASLAMVFSANLVMRVPQHWHFIAMIAWLPVALLLLRKGLRATKRWIRLQYAVGVGVVLGVCVLVGFPQQAIYTYLFVLLYAAVSLAFSPPVRTRFSIVTLFGLAAAALIVSLFVAAPLVIPAGEYAHFTARTKAVGEAYLSNDFGVSPLYFLRGFVVYEGVTWPGSTGIRMLGLGALMLAIGAVFHTGKRMIALYAVLFLVFIDCALGPPFPFGWLIDRLAPFRVENPARATTYAAFALAMLSGFGVDALGQRAMDRRYGIWVFGGTGVFLFALLVYWRMTSPVLPVSVFGWAIPGLTVVVLLATVLSRRANWLIPLVPVLVFAETWVWSDDLIRYVVKTDPFQGDWEMVVDRAEFPTDNRRVAAPYLYENTPMYTLTPAMTGYDPLYIERSREVLAAPDREGVYDRRLTEGDLTGANLRGEFLFTRLFWLADTYVNGSLPPKDLRFDPNAIAFVQTESDLPVARVDWSESFANPGEIERVDRVEIIHFSANEIRARVADLPGPRVLTFLDSAYPGWNAYVDGERVEIISAANAFKAVIVPAGTHEVRFAFQPLVMRIGLSVGIVTLIGCIGLFFGYQRFVR